MYWHGSSATLTLSRILTDVLGAATVADGCAPLSSGDTKPEFSSVYWDSVSSGDAPLPTRSPDLSRPLPPDTMEKVAAWNLKRHAIDAPPIEETWGDLTIVRDSAPGAPLVHEG